MKNTESEQMLNSQKTILTKINNEKKQLLLSSSDDVDKYTTLKNKLGWVDTDNIIDNSLRKVLELEDVQAKVVSSNVFTMDSIVKYCIANNYVLCSITEYKGQLSEELLGEIDNYSRERGLTLSSGAELDCLFLLCPLKDVQDNSDDIKLSKRYKKTVLSKILLLEKVTDRRTHSEDYYNLIFEIGTKKPITNLINSIFKTYTKSGNFINNSILYTSIFIVLSIIGMFYKNINYSWYFLPIVMTMILIILFIKIFADSNNGPNRSYQDFPHVNIFADGNFSRISDCDNSTAQRYNFMCLYKKYNRDGYYDKLLEYKKLVFKKFFIGAVILMVISSCIMSLGIRINKMLILNKNNVQIIMDGTNDDDQPISIHYDYTKTGLLTFDRTKTVLLMTKDAIEQRRIEAYDKAHAKK